MIKIKILVNCQNCQKLENRLKRQAIRRELTNTARTIKHNKNHLGNDH